MYCARIHKRKRLLNSFDCIGQHEVLRRNYVVVPKLAAQGPVVNTPGPRNSYIPHQAYYWRGRKNTEASCPKFSEIIDICVFNHRRSMLHRNNVDMRLSHAVVSDQLTLYIPPAERPTEDRDHVGHEAKPTTPRPHSGDRPTAIRPSFDLFLLLLNATDQTP